MRRARRNSIWKARELFVFLAIAVSMDYLATGHVASQHSENRTTASSAQPSFCESGVGDLTGFGSNGLKIFKGTTIKN